MLVWFKFCRVQDCPKNQASFGTICLKLYFQKYGSNEISVSSSIKLDREQKLCLQQNLKLHLGVPLKRSSLIFPFKTFTLTGVLFFLIQPNSMLPQFQRLQFIQPVALFCFEALKDCPSLVLFVFCSPHYPSCFLLFSPSPFLFFWTFVLSWSLLLLFLLVLFASARDMVFGAKGVST